MLEAVALPAELPTLSPPIRADSHSNGAGLPMLAIAYGGQAVTTRVRRLARIAPKLQQGFGVVVIAFAVATYFQYDTLIVAWLTGFYPNGQIGL